MKVPMSYIMEGVEKTLYSNKIKRKRKEMGENVIAHVDDIQRRRARKI